MSNGTVTLVLEANDGFRFAEDGEVGTHRVPAELWDKYSEAMGALLLLEDEIEAKATQPVYVTPDQEKALRSQLKRGAWIVVREPGAVPSVQQRAPVLVPVEEVVPLSAAAPPVGPPPAPVDRYAEGDRVMRASCAARSGLPHTIARYVITDIPGRVDGLCQCGLRIPDVRCPHTKQKLVDGQPTCKACGYHVVSGAGVINNARPAGYGGGAPDPNVKLPVPVDFGGGKDQNAISRAFRSQDA